MNAKDWFEVGRIGAPYGVKGWVHVESWTDPPERLLDYGEWRVQTPDGERVVPAEGRVHGKGLVARFEGVEDRDAAARLRGAVISVSRERLGPLRAREFYRADLIGLRVRNTEGEELGVLQHFIDAPGGAVMVISGSGQEHWVPAVPRHLLKVDLEAGLIEVDWPAQLE